MTLLRIGRFFAVCSCPAAMATLFVLLFSLELASGKTSELDAWHLRNPAPTGNGLRAIASGGGIFVAVGENGAIVRSTDGLTWSAQASPSSDFLLGVAYGGGTFAAVSLEGNIWRSRDGVNWSLALGRPGSMFLGIAYGNSTFVTIGGGEVLTSADAIAWTAHEVNLGDWGQACIGFENGSFWASNGAGRELFTSLDGMTWISKPLPWFATPSDIASAGNILVAVDYGTIIRSTDSFTTTSSITNVPAVFYGVTYGQGRFIAAGFEPRNGLPSEGVVYSSPDGQTWTKGKIDGTDMLMAIEFNGKLFAAVSETGQIFTSSDGDTWANRSGGIRAALYGGAYAQNQFVVVGERGTILTSPTGTQWTAQESGLSNTLAAVAYGSQTWVAVGTQGTVATSADGKAWTGTSLGAAVNLTAVTFHSGLFVAVGSDGFSELSGVIWTSLDGVAWQERPVSCALCQVGDLVDVIYAEDQQAFVAVGWADVVASNDGLNWQLLYPSPPGTAITAGNGLMVIADSDSIMTATRGDQWARAFQGNYEFKDIAYFNGTFLATGKPSLNTSRASALLSSRDATNWVEIGGIQAPDLFKIVVGPDCVLLLGEAGTILQSDTSPFDLRFLDVQLGATDFKATLVLPAPRSVRIETSTNLVDWSDLQVSSAPTDRFRLTDSTSQKCRFYRAIAQ